MKDRGDLDDIADPIRSGRLEHVVRLVGIEGAELTAEHRMIVGANRPTTVHVVQNVDGPAEMGVPRKSLVAAAQRICGQVILGGGEKLLRRGCGSWRLCAGAAS